MRKGRSDHSLVTLWRIHVPAYQRRGFALNLRRFHSHSTQGRSAGLVPGSRIKIVSMSAAPNVSIQSLLIYPSFILQLVMQPTGQKMGSQFGYDISKTRGCKDDSVGTLLENAARQHIRLDACKPTQSTDHMDVLKKRKRG